MNRLFDEDHPAPHLILGHTHVPRWQERIRKRKAETFDKYTNSGTAGMHEGLIWCVEIVDGIPTLHAWFEENGPSGQSRDEHE